jgi:hypothetical protein
MIGFLESVLYHRTSPCVRGNLDPAVFVWYCEHVAILMKLLLWLILLVLCWPLALLALIAYPFAWLLLLPLRLLGIVVDGVFEFLRALLLLPARVLGGGR